MTKPNSQRFRTAKITLLAIITIFGYISAFSIGNMTMISLPLTMAVCFVLASVAGVLVAPFIASVTSSINIALNAAIGAIILTGVFSGLFITSNFVFSDAATAHSEQAVVKRKYKEKHYRTKRISRNRYTRGEPYYEYYLDIHYSNGRTKPMLVNINRYRATHEGDTVDVTLRQGLFGIPVIRR